MAGLTHLHHLHHRTNDHCLPTRDGARGLQSDFQVPPPLLLLSLLCACVPLRSGKGMGERMIPPSQYQKQLGYPKGKTAANSYITYTVNW